MLCSHSRQGVSQVEIQSFEWIDLTAYQTKVLAWWNSYWKMKEIFLWELSSLRSTVFISLFRAVVFELQVIIKDRIVTELWLTDYKPERSVQNVMTVWFLYDTVSHQWIVCISVTNSGILTNYICSVYICAFIDSDFKHCLYLHLTNTSLLNQS